jgi:AcrR family transcriptional regulator
MPKLWSKTIKAHHQDVKNAILDAVGSLVTEHGLHSVAMSKIAEKTGVGRATLYKYFPEIETLLSAWHERHIARHLEHLAEIRDKAGPKQLEAVFEAYALISHQRHDTELAALLHRGKHMAKAEQQLHNLIRELLAGGVKTGEVRKDVGTDELASYCLHALTAASGLPTKAAVRRLVAVTLAGLRPDS